jgi:hypothetical protein
MPPTTVHNKHAPVPHIPSPARTRRWHAGRGRCCGGGSSDRCSSTALVLPRTRRPAVGSTALAAGAAPRVHALLPAAVPAVAVAVVLTVAVVAAVAAGVGAASWGTKMMMHVQWASQTPLRNSRYPMLQDVCHRLVESGRGRWQRIRYSEAGTVARGWKTARVGVNPLPNPASTSPTPDNSRPTVGIIALKRVAHRRPQRVSVEASVGTSTYHGHCPRGCCRARCRPADHRCLRSGRWSGRSGGAACAPWRPRCRALHRRDRTDKALCHASVHVTYNTRECRSGADTAGASTGKRVGCVCVSRVVGASAGARRTPTQAQAPHKPLTHTTTHQSSLPA